MTVVINNNWLTYFLGSLSLKIADTSSFSCSLYQLISLSLPLTQLCTNIYLANECLKNAISKLHPMLWSNWRLQLLMSIWIRAAKSKHIFCLLVWIIIVWIRKQSLKIKFKIGTFTICAFCQLNETHHVPIWKICFL